MWPYGRYGVVDFRKSKIDVVIWSLWGGRFQKKQKRCSHSRAMGWSISEKAKIDAVIGAL
ncbi:hypothetical protein D3H55_23770 [Bacillus salacetis]|uniref:Uncharacterized protein n=1 Tax=Bacillus salacetis TaxID=2315464 RepID=A0A3A1QKE2_9BACI|nr:hypothetical protein [Bacillus salacetis]RIW26085.1 hypothetical protein D3H55_23770 [Bacillus salacetis]